MHHSHPGRLLALAAAALLTAGQRRAPGICPEVEATGFAAGDPLRLAALPPRPTAAEVREALRRDPLRCLLARPRSGPGERRGGGHGARYLVPGPALAAGGFAVLAAGLLIANRGGRRGDPRLFRCGWWATVIGGAGVLYAGIWWAVSTALA